MVVHVHTEKHACVRAVCKCIASNIYDDEYSMIDLAKESLHLVTLCIQCNRIN